MNHKEKQAWRKKVAEYFRTKGSIEATARAYKISPTRIYSICREFGVPLGAHSHEGKRERRKQMAEYAREHGVKSAAGEFGVAVKTVTDACAEHGLEVNDGRDLGGVTYRIIAALQNGEQPLEVARRLETSCHRIYQVRQKCLEYGVTVPDLKGKTLMEVFADDAERINGTEDGSPGVRSFTA